MRQLLLLSLILSCTSPAAAFEISGSKWPGAAATFYINIEGFSPSNISWNSAFTQAANDWTQETDFDLTVVNEYRDPCRDDGANGVDFTSTICGTSYGAKTLAVTIRKFQVEVLGPARIAEADIVINEDVEYNIFDGPIVQFGVPGLDFRRVALHELGHAIGLDHESGPPAIMAPNIGNLDRLQADDIAGVNALYDGLSNCTIRPLKLGAVNDALSAGDCQVFELTAGGDDNSFVDVFQFALSSPASMRIEMTSESLDSVLLLADANLSVFDFDNNALADCDSTLTANLAAGSYYLLTNTFVEPVKDDCGTSGDYALTVQYTSADPVALGAASSFLGDVSSAEFFGGISANNGFSYGNVFTPSDSLDIDATINIDPAHQGKPGFLVAAAANSNEIILLNQQGQFELYDPQAGQLTRARELVLGATERISFANDLVPAELGISSIEVDFVVGYGLHANPDEIYFHGTPLSLIVAPE